jgi:hypothetical protein
VVYEEAESPYTLSTFFHFGRGLTLFGQKLYYSAVLNFFYFEEIDNDLFFQHL